MLIFGINLNFSKTLKSSYIVVFKELSAMSKFTRVQKVFSDSAEKYQLMNSLMSAGLDKYWRTMALEIAGCKLDDHVLDLASGSGELAIMAKRRCRQGVVIAADFNREMMEMGRDNIIDSGLGGKCPTCVCAAENLPFADQQFDHVLIGFGWRNFFDRELATREIHRVLKPHGRLTILELSIPPNEKIAMLYETISSQILPFLGELIGNNPESYEYLHESIRQQPSVGDYVKLLEANHFHMAEQQYLTMGVVSVIRSTKNSIDNS